MFLVSAEYCVGAYCDVAQNHPTSIRDNAAYIGEINRIITWAQAKRFVAGAGLLG